MVAGEVAAKEVPWDITLDFEYVVNRSIPPQLCFGTKVERETLPREGPAMSSFMRKIGHEDNKLTGPGTYEMKDSFYGLEHRPTSKYGLGSKSPRFKEKHEYQPPAKEPYYVVLKKNCAPFNSTSKRKPLFEVPNHPAACDYLPDFKKKEMAFVHSFGGRKVLKCPVAIKCVPYNLDECAYCGCLCSAQGDYWQYEDRISLCRKHYSMFFTHCMAKFSGVKLADFKAVRDCFFAHSHNSCKAALKIMSSEDITKKLRKEAYLDLYFPLRRFCEKR